MKEYEKRFRHVTPYVPGEQPDGADIIKLNTNENPYPPSPKVLEAIRGMDGDALRRYPDTDATALVRAIAGRYGVSEEEVFVGVGSDDVISMSFLTFFNTTIDHPLLFPDITYSFYDVWAELYGIPYETVPVDEDFGIRPEDYGTNAGGIIFPNPNAPTSIALPLIAVEEIVRSHPDAIVIVDEAYVDFGAASAVPLTDKYDNLLVIQTFSKSRAMAGMRIGFAIGQKHLIAALRNVKNSVNSYTLSAVAIASGAAAIEDEAYFADRVAAIKETRDRTALALADLGFFFPPSDTNFFFVHHPKMHAKEIFEALRTRGIYARYFARPRIDDHLRITVGTDAEMERLIAALRDIVPNQGKESSTDT